eukprot:gene10735-17810_t
MRRNVTREFLFRVLGDTMGDKAYLTREFFQMLGDTMGDRVLLMIARDTNADDEIVAGALNMIGSHALYGRNWGCKREYKALHFELCYYQAIEEAIARKLPRVEAGAQGEHKLQRGYLPSITYSSHFLRDPTLNSAVSMFLEREREGIQNAMFALTLQASPFKSNDSLDSLFSMDSVSSTDSSGAHGLVIASLGQKEGWRRDKE